MHQLIDQPALFLKKVKVLFAIPMKQCYCIISRVRWPYLLILRWDESPNFCCKNRPRCLINILCNFNNNFITCIFLYIFFFKYANASIFVIMKSIT
ncbi:hypothetical protein CROQUDRAFT_406833 [Cronartium quercuum f. sp. fusiforme G11]|uniref:Uncharacterized protein n=1 Tax=Cronartium quercuum f. sp. fusiforme G11 TaxID=708437 RepID=A0A9P6TGP9_9BASI|nr:hypothetical protein CROQUDRAFT_406833 [Cronartium quercuum f. sp. fusiforme G11]